MKKIISIFNKSLKEHIREFWILFFVLFTAPFFVFLYYLIAEGEAVFYKAIIINNDIEINSVNYGEVLIATMKSNETKTEGLDLKYIIETNREKSESLLKSKKADLLFIIPSDFTKCLLTESGSGKITPEIEFVGDITSMNYIIPAIWTNEILNSYITGITGIGAPYQFKETSLGLSGQMSEFELWVPGLLILAVVLSIFSASAAIVKESEINALTRLKITKLKSFEFLSGIGLLQVIIGIVTLTFTILTAAMLGFDFNSNSMWVVLLISVLTSISIIAFSLILGGFCRSVKDVSIIGVFPMFLLMFFTGAAMPMKVNKLLTIGGYDIGWNGFLSPTHAVNAINKILIMGYKLKGIIPEIISIILLSVIYFVTGTWVFKRRHLRIG